MPHDGQRIGAPSRFVFDFLTEEQHLKSLVLKKIVNQANSEQTKAKGWSHQLPTEISSRRTSSSRWHILKKENGPCFAQLFDFIPDIESKLLKWQFSRATWRPVSATLDWRCSSDLAKLLETPTARFYSNQWKRPFFDNQTDQPMKTPLFWQSSRSKH